MQTLRLNSSHTVTNTRTTQGRRTAPPATWAPKPRAISRPSSCRGLMEPQVGLTLLSPRTEVSRRRQRPGVTMAMAMAGAPATALHRPDVEISGNARYGTLVAMGESHAASHAGLTNPRLYVQGQQKILEVLLEHNPRAVFLENNDAWLTSNTTMQPAKKQLIQQAFAGWTPGSPLSRQQTELLYKNEAVHIYAALSRDTVTFPPADSAAINERIVQGLRAGKTLYSMADLVTTKREEYLIGKLQGFYKEHPGATAAVIFGSGHDILRYCNAADFPPKASWYNCSGGDMAAVERERATMRNASQRG